MGRFLDFLSNFAPWNLIHTSNIKKKTRIMKKKIQFSLVYRDMWQSSGKFQPRKDQLAKILPQLSSKWDALAV